MGLVRNRTIKKRKLLNQIGQSTVEYILLMAVITTISISILKSDVFQNIFGRDSQFFAEFGKRVEFSYRHGHMGTRDERDSDDYNYSPSTVSHKSYVMDDGNSRFFIPTDKYPK